MANILIVDDEVQVRELLYNALKMQGYRVTTLPSAEQALEIIFEEPFDLVILDIEIGQESGITVLEKIREGDKQIPVVIYSGNVTADIEKEARNAGANEVLKKDTGIILLVEQIGKIISAKDRISKGLSLNKEKIILIVDDDDNVRYITRSFFTNKGFKTIEARDGNEALELIGTENISSVLLDIEMPGMDGIATLEKLLEINPKLGVVMTTGVQNNEKVKKAIELGAYDYVLKPFDFMYLELVVLSKLAIAESE
ncbi:response regulator [Candidatus Omnitrophota bacterium]